MSVYNFHQLFPFIYCLIRLVIDDKKAPQPYYSIEITCTLMVTYMNAKEIFFDYLLFLGL